MKKLVGFLLILAAGAVLGYVFHDPIDAKLKGKFGDEKVEAAKEKIEEGGEKALVITEGAVEGAKKAIQDSAKTEE